MPDETNGTGSDATGVKQVRSMASGAAVARLGTRPRNIRERVTIRSPMYPNSAPPRDGILGLSYRQLVAVIALANALVATYLHLWKIGKAGSLACGEGHGCVIAQMSSYGWILGVDVALIGAVGYALILIVAIIGTFEALSASRAPAIALAALVYPAILFTIRLKYAEFIILRTFCPWCAISAISITTLGVIVALELRRFRRPAP